MTFESSAFCHRTWREHVEDLGFPAPPTPDISHRLSSASGVTIYSPIAGVDFRFQYDGEFSDRVSSNAGSLKAIMPF